LFLAAALVGPRAVRPARAGLTFIATTGNAAPGGGTFGKHFGVPVINNQGQVAFSVPVDQTDTDAGVYQGTSMPNLIALLRPGGITTAVSSFVAQNDGGVVVFSANNGTQIVSRDISGLHIVANAGDGVEPVGGGPIYTLGSFSDPTIDAHGDVAYTESGNGPFYGAVAAGELLTYGGKGDEANGLIDQVFGPVSIAALSGSAFTTTFFDVFEKNGVASTGFWFGDGASLLSGVKDASGDGLAIVVNGASFPMISPAGAVFRTGTFNTGTNVSSSGVFLVTESMGELFITTIAKGGDAAPGGGTFANAVNVLGSDNNYLPFDEPQINDNGDIVFVAWLDGGPGHGVYRFTQAHGLEAMALEGHAPYAAAAGFRNAVINNHGVVAFQAFDGSAPTGRGVYITDGVNTVHAGSDLFFGQEGSSTGAFAQAYFGSEDEGLSPLNDHNEVTFVRLAGVNGAQSVMKFSVDPQWGSPTSGSWDVAANWLFATLPGPDGTTTIPGQASGPIVVTGPAAPTTVSTLAIGGGASKTAELDVQNGGPLTATIEVLVFPNGILGGTGSVTSADIGNSQGGMLTGHLTLNGPVFNDGLINGDFTFNGNVTNELTGAIEGNHTFNGNVTNFGTISPGHSPGTVTVNRNLTLQAEIEQGLLAGSDLEIEIGGPNPSDYDVIDVNGHATLGGQLNVTFINGFTPTAGQRFHILNASSVSGTFDAVTGAVVTSFDGGLEIAAPSAVTVTATGKALVGCASATTKAGSGFTAARSKALDACVGGVFKCLQENDAGAKRDACVTKAGAACTKDLAKATDLGTKLTAAIDKACAPVGPSDMLAAQGVGFINVAGECQQNFGITLDTVASIEQCVLRTHACRGESTLNAEAPRAHELMQLAGVATSDLDALACLPDNMGGGGDLGAPKGVGKAVVGCEAALFKGGNALVAKMGKSLAACAGAIDVCITEKPGDATCVPKAQTGCTKDFTAIDDALSKLDDAIVKTCTPPAIDFADVVTAGGADMSALTGECTTLGVTDITGADGYAACLERRAMCDVEDMMRLENPRAGELLALGGRVLEDSFCP
jgi:hypothetical protein